MIVILLFGISTAGSIIFIKVKEEFCHTFVKRYFDELDNIDYIPKKAFGKSQGLTKGEVYQLNFINKPHIFDSFDLLNGEIDGISFSSSDVHLQNQHSNGKTTYLAPHFLVECSSLILRNPSMVKC